MSPGERAVTIDVLWSLVLPPTRSALEFAQDLYVLWPGSVEGDTVPGPRDEGLSRYVEARGFTAIDSGRLPLLAQGLYQMGDDVPPVPEPGGAPYVTFVRLGGPLGLTEPVTFVRIPWTPKLANRTYLMNLRMRLAGLVKEKNASWLERTFWGRRQIVGLSFNDVHARGLFPMYLEHRDRVLRLADEPAQLMIQFTDSDRLKIDDVYPRTASRRPSDTRASTELVSAFFTRSEGAIPQLLAVEFGYFTNWQVWVPLLVAAVFFVLGNLAGPLVAALARHLGPKLAGRILLGPRSTAARERQVGTLIPREALAELRVGETTLDDVVRLFGPATEEQRRVTGPGRLALVYRGRRILPHHRRRLPWLATVHAWDVEHEEVEIAFEERRVHDVEVRTRHARLARPEPD